MSDLRVVPWFDFQEFKDVANNISDYKSKNIVFYYHIIQIWLTRLPKTNIPRSILCAYELLTAYFEKSSQSLALALMRFVSLLSSESQDRERPYFAVPLIALSQKVGIPCWLADLRNDVAHGVIPSLGILENAFDWAINYLKNFWNSNVEHIHNQHQFFESRFKSRSSEFSEMITRLFSRDMTKSSLSELSGVSQSTVFNYRLVISKLITSALFAQTNFLMSPEVSIKRAINIQTEKLKFLHKWLYKNKIIHTFITQLMLDLTSGDVYEVCLLWCLQWLGAIQSWKLGETSVLSSFIDGDVLLNIDWRRSLSHVMFVLCPAYEGLLTQIIDLYQPVLEPRKRNNILELVDIYFGRKIPQETSTILKSKSLKLCCDYSWTELPLGFKISWFILILICF